MGIIARLNRKAILGCLENSDQNQMKMGKDSQFEGLLDRRNAMTIFSGVIVTALGGCRKTRLDDKQISMRPRFVLEDQPTVPVGGNITVSDCVCP